MGPTQTVATPPKWGQIRPSFSGGVSIGTDAPSAARNRGPRWSRTQRTTDGYEPVNPSAVMISNNDLANSFELPTNSAVSRSAHTADHPVGLVDRAPVADHRP